MRIYGLDSIVASTHNTNGRGWLMGRAAASGRAITMAGPCEQLLIKGSAFAINCHDSLRCDGTCISHNTHYTARRVHTYVRTSQYSQQHSLVQQQHIICSLSLSSSSAYNAVINTRGIFTACIMHVHTYIHSDSVYYYHAEKAMCVCEQQSQRERTGVDHVAAIKSCT